MSAYLHEVLYQISMYWFVLFLMVSAIIALSKPFRRVLGRLNEWVYKLFIKLRPIAQKWLGQRREAAALKYINELVR